MRQYLTEMREEERRRIADESSDSKSFNLLGTLAALPTSSILVCQQN